MHSSESEIFECVRTIIADTLQVSPDEVGMDSVLEKDFGAGSIDLVDIMSRIESELHVQFCDTGALDTLEELFGSDVLSEQGALTELGAEVMRERMPEASQGEIVAGLPVPEVPRLYTTRTWVRAALELLEARPRVCQKCAGEKLRLARISVVACEGCDEEIACPTQQDLLADWARKFQRGPDARR